MCVVVFNIDMFCFYRFKELQIQSEDRLRDLTETLREFGPESQHFLSGEFPGSMSTQDMLHNINTRKSTNVMIMYRLKMYYQ